MAATHLALFLPILLAVLFAGWILTTSTDSCFHVLLCILLILMQGPLQGPAQWAPRRLLWQQQQQQQHGRPRPQQLPQQQQALGWPAAWR
jgi:hypothetical protein